MSRTFYKRNLPHLHYSDGIYFITFRLANSIPIDKLNEMKTNANSKNSQEKTRFFLKYETLLESGEFGEKYLANDLAAEIVVNSLRFYDNKDFNLICYTIMPNHVHMVFELNRKSEGIRKIMHSIKGYSGKECNKILYRSGKFWQDESFDRLIRDERELYMVIKYVLLNPVKCGYVKEWKEWKYTYCNKHYEVF